MVRRSTEQPIGTTSSQKTEQSPTLKSAWRALDTVADPEVPVVSVVELGMIADVRESDGMVSVDLTPTFAGCPALQLIQDEILAALSKSGFHNAVVNIVYDPPWTTNRITDDARRKLKQFGLAPPGEACAGQMPDIETIQCPYCDSSNTELESIFGPTLCRSIHYCHACLQSFEHFKAV